MLKGENQRSNKKQSPDVAGALISFSNKYFQAVVLLAIHREDQNRVFRESTSFLKMNLSIRITHQIH